MSSPNLNQIMYVYPKKCAIVINMVHGLINFPEGIQDLLYSKKCNAIVISNLETYFNNTNLTRAKGMLANFLLVSRGVTVVEVTI